MAAAQNLLADIKRLLGSAREDYEQKHWDTYSFHVSALNRLIKKAKEINSKLDISEIKEAEHDQVIHTSHTMGMPYNPETKPSVGSKTKKLREVINVADKLFNEMSSVVEIDSRKNSKKGRAISQLQKLKTTIDTLKDGSPDSDDFKKWKRDVEVAIEQTFPPNSRHLDDISISYYPSSTYMVGINTQEPTQSEYQAAYKKGLDRARLVLQSMIEEMETYWPDDSAQETTKTTGETIELICNRFHTVVRQLKKRRKGKVALEITDEYDVQDLMRALLHIFFDDIRPEEVTPSYAGKSARVDFLLKVEKTVLEIKHGRTSLTEKELGDELIIDIRRYKDTHPDCQALYCFVYDPQGYIDNPRGMENDLSRVTEGMPVKVIIAPKTH